ncbi:MAG: M36 family metallopeptidase [Acidimicrobiales bacterium]
MRRTRARPDRAAGRAGFSVAGDEPQGVHVPGSPGFVRWQARQAAILAVETWEKAIGGPLTSWAAEATNPQQMLLLPDHDEDVNAYYDRNSFSFYHRRFSDTTIFSGASTDVVAHEIGHGVLDALRPDLWDTPYLEVGGFHEAFGDITAIVTALADRATRKALLAASPDLGTANFVEGMGESLADAFRRVAGPTHSASKPRRALNTFQWQLPETLPQHGGPDHLYAEVHSIAKLMSGCFYDVVRGMFATSGSRSEARLWLVTKTAARLFHKASKTAPEVPRFYRAVGRAMVLADGGMNGGVNREIIGKAFAGHGLPLGSSALLAPELALAGDAPAIDRSAGVAFVHPATTRDLRGRIGAAPRSRATVSMVDLDEAAVAKVSFRTEVALDDVDPRLQGAVAYVEVPALVGGSGRSAALLHAPRAGTPVDEVHQFVRSLLAHGQVDAGPASASRSRRGLRVVADIEPVAEKPTHALVRHAGRQELRRVRFTC